MYTLEITDAPPRRLFAVPHRGPYTEIANAFGRLDDLLAEHGLRGGEHELIGVYYDNPDVTARAALRSHAGITVSEAAHCPPGLEEVRLEGGRYAVVRVAGPYSGLYPAYVWLFGEGLAGAGVTPSRAAEFELYHNTPSETPPEDLVTDIHVPIG